MLSISVLCPQCLRPIPLEAVCAALLCLPTLQLWKQGLATAPNTGLLKINILTRLYQNFPKVLFVLWIF